MDRPLRSVLLAYLVLFGSLYAAFGVQSPYLPRLLQEHGLGAEAIGTVLAAGTAIRLTAGPAAGYLADRLDIARLVFAGCATGAAVAAIFYLPARGFWPLLAVNLAQASALAPLAPLCDSLVLAAAGTRRYGFDYAWVRGAGSGAFILGTVLAGQMVGRYGLAAVIWLNAALLAAAAFYAPAVPRLLTPPAQAPGARRPAIDLRYGVPALLGMPAFRRVVLVAALILGSHALHDGFVVIRWTAAGIGPGTAGLLWSELVAAEVIVFLFVGRKLLDRLGPAGAATLAAVAGIVRWTVSAETAWLPAVVLIQPLHGITFALLHLACMRRLAEAVPPRLSATALTLYGTVAIGAVSALLTLVSGWLYGAVGPAGFWMMAALCATALPFARRL